MIFNHTPTIYALQLGGYGLRWYALMYFLGFVISGLILTRSQRFRQLGQGTGDALEMITWMMVGILVGGRLGYVLLYNLPYYLGHPAEIVALNLGGRSFHGGFLGGILALWVLLKGRKQPFWPLADQVTFTIPWGLCLGRIGNFLLGELWGKPTGANWGVIFAATGGGELPRHPTQLYEAGLEGPVLFAFLWLIGRWQGYRPGMILGGFLIGYALLRSLVEFWRMPDAHLGYLLGGRLTLGQLLCLPMLVLGAILFERARQEKLKININPLMT